MRQRKSILQPVDTPIAVLWVVLSVAGCIAIYSATSGGETVSFFDFSAKHMRQVMYWCVSLIAAFLVVSLDYKAITQTPYLIYGLAVLLLALTLVIGTEVNGAKAWIKFGSVQIQPAEFAKLATALVLAKYMGNRNRIFTQPKKMVVVIGLVLVPVLLIFLQPDIGSLLLFAGLIFMFLREGLSPVPFYISILLITISFASLYFGFTYTTLGIISLTAIILFIIRKRRKAFKPLFVGAVLAVAISGVVLTTFSRVLKDYQQDRVMIMLGKLEDKQGAGYNLWQSKMAVGSGGFAGKGYLKGTQTQGGFVPEVSTDYIFASIGEEWGFLGSLFVVGMFAILLFRLFVVAERQRSNFSRIFIYSVACFLFTHVVVNIAMVIGLFPTIGIPLPFFSYGGSSLLVFTLMLAAVMRLDAERLYILR